MNYREADDQVFAVVEARGAEVFGAGAPSAKEGEAVVDFVGPEWI